MSKKSKAKAKARRNKTKSLPPWKNKKKKTLPVSRLTQDEINAYKRDMQKIVDYANSRIDESLSRHEGSIELHRFLSDDMNRRFDISQLTDPADIRVAMTELRTVLNTIDTGSQKSAVDTAIMEAEVFRHQFGNQHNAAFTDPTGKVRVRHYNTNDVFDSDGNLIRRAVDPTLASKAFAAYRRLEEDLAGYIGRQGQELMFGSENLIILLYDFYDKNPGADYNFSSDHSTMDAYDYARPLIDQWILDQLRELEGVNYSFEEANEIITNWDDILDRRYF